MGLEERFAGLAEVEAEISASVVMGMGKEFARLAMAQVEKFVSSAKGRERSSSLAQSVPALEDSAGIKQLFVSSNLTNSMKSCPVGAYQ